MGTPREAGQVPSGNLRPAAPVTPGRSRESLVRRETLASALINGTISLGFFLAVFGGSSPIAVPSVGNYAFDFLPQSFVVGLMASLVPGFLARRAIVSGRMSGFALAAPAAGAIVRQAVVTALVTLAAGAVVALLTLVASRTGTIGHGTGLVLKIAYGAALGALTTRLTLSRLLKG